MSVHSRGLRRITAGRGTKGFLAVLGTLAVIFATLTGVPGAAHAAQNSDIAVSGVTLTTDGGGQAKVGDTLHVKGDWDATQANPKPGDTFTIGLPEELVFGGAFPFALTGPNSQGDIVTWGNCLTNPTTNIATCTLTDAVVTDPEVVKGTFNFDVKAAKATTEKDVDFNLNGTPVAVPLPGGGGIDDGVTPPSPWNKSGVMNSNHWSMGWTINLPGDRLKGHGVVNVGETLGANHKLCQPSGLKVTAIRGTATSDVTSIATVVPGADDQHFTIKLTEPQNGYDDKTTYRITYNTCTPDGQIDPKGTVYDNTATVDVWGESSGVIGVTQDWDFTGQISKSGSVLGGSDRNGKIAWTVTDDGNNLAGKTSVDFSEQLTGDHAVCSDTISGIKVIERYGPSGAKDVPVTGNLDISTVSSSAQAFDVTLAVKSGSGFAFKSNPYVYLIQYSTCATTDGLPTGGTQFGNTATVAGKKTTGTATVPTRAEGKSGQLNGQTVPVDGVDYLPQTTMNWNVTVPGQNLTDVNSDLTVTDTLSASQLVCAGSGGSVPSRLALSVQAKDQVSGGGLATKDLTSTVTATVADNLITFTIPQPTLPQPGGGADKTGFSREYQYVINYTTCTTSGGMDAPGTVYSNQATVNGKQYSSSLTQNFSGGGTGQGVPRGSVAVTKSLADTPGAALVPAGTVFTVHAKEIDPTGKMQKEYDLKVPLNGDPVSGPNARGTGWKIELSEPTLPNVAGVTFGSPSFQPSNGVAVSPDGKVATATITPATNIKVALTNTALLGSLSVLKQIDGPASGQVDPNRTFQVTAKIDVSGLGAGFPAQPDRTLTVKAGDPVPLANLPIGAKVSFSETLPPNDDVLTWSPATIAPASITVLAAHATTPATITVTNHVQRTVGTFSISKTVTGDQAGNPAVPATVTVNAAWNQEGTPGSKTLSLPTDGTTVPLGVNLLIGTKVTLTEVPLRDGSSIAWAAPVWSGTGVAIDGESAVVTVGRDAQARVSLQNHAATSTAGISLLKGIAGPAAGEVPAGTTFPVTASWLDSDGKKQSKQLQINATEPTPLGIDLPAGTVVTLTEGDRPTIKTVDWGSVAISGDGVTDNGDGSATVVVSDQQGAVALISVVNQANWAPGTLSIAKKVTGVSLSDRDVPKTVTVNASWFDENLVEHTTSLTVPTDGTVVPLGQDLPYGTQVTLTEQAPTNSARFTWDAPVWSGDATADGSTAVVTIGAASTAAVSLTNNATAILGSLSLQKALTGSGAGAVPAGTLFPFTVAWVDLLGKSHAVDVQLTVGKPNVIADVPVGTPITVTEHDSAAPNGTNWQGVTWKADGQSATVTAGGTTATVTITGEAGASATVTATNAFVAGLAATGAGMGPATLGALGLLAALLVAAGAWLLRRRRATE